MQHELTDQQHQAIELLVSGQKSGCIAETLYIRRETLWRWRQLPEFQQAYEQCQRLRREEMREQMTDLVQLSLSVVAHELTEKHFYEYDRKRQLTAALSILRMLQPAGCLANDPPPPPGNVVSIE